MDDLDVSVLICTYNRADLLHDALEKIVSQVVPAGLHHEIVVVDNGSVDKTKDVVREVADSCSVPIRYVLETSEGICHARNRALREARGNWFAFIDDDELADPMWLSELWAATRESGAAVVGGSVVLDLKEEQLEGLGREYRRSLREREAQRYGDRLAPCPAGAILGTGNLMIERTVIDSIGGFDESMQMGGEDADLLIRARSSGFQPWYAPNAVVIHRVMSERRTTEHVKLDSLRSGAMLAMLRRKHHGWFSTVLEMTARIGQAAVLTVPKLIAASLRNDQTALLDQRIKWWRMLGYVRWVLVLAGPDLPQNRAYVSHLNYRTR